MKIYYITAILLCFSLTIQANGKESKKAHPNILETLPEDVRGEIAKSLELEDIGKLSLTSRKGIEYANAMWRQKYNEILGNFDDQVDEIKYFDMPLYEIVFGKDPLVINWMKTFFHNLQRVVSKNWEYIQKNKKLPTTQRGKLLIGANLEVSMIPSDDVVTYNLDNLDFSGADLRYASIRFSPSLVGAVAPVRSANFTGADLSHAYISNVSFENVIFNQAKLRFAKINQSHFRNCKFNKAIMKNVTFDYGKISNTTFVEASLENILFKNSILDQATYSYLKNNESVRFEP